MKENNKANRRNRKKKPESERTKILPKSQPALLKNSVLVLVFFMSIFFYTRNWTLGDETVQRGFLFFLSFLSPSSFLGILKTLPETEDLVTFSQTSVLLGKWFLLLAVFGVGSLLLRLFRKGLTLTAAENLFFSFSGGLALCSCFWSVASVLGFARIPEISIFLTGGFALYGFFSLGNIYMTYRRRRNSFSGFSRMRRLVWSGLGFFLFAEILLYSFGALIPVSEYDMLEYHLAGVREFYNSGTAGFYPYNVYMNMPFGIEMFFLWGRNLSGNEMTGILIGKGLVSASALICGLGIFSFGQRFFGTRTGGFLAALLYLSFAYNFQVFSIGLNDGVLGLAGFAAFYVLLLFFRYREEGRFLGYITLLSLFTGFAISGKYTAVVFILLPILTFLILFELTRPILRRWNWETQKLLPFGQTGDVVTSLSNKSGSVSNGSNPSATRRTPARSGRLFAVRIVLLFLLGTTIFGGSWYAKNYFRTGNPVYPLAWNIFGDSTGTWNESKNIRWERAHSSSDRSIGAMTGRLTAFCWNDDFSSPFFSAGIPILFGVSFLLGRRMTRYRMRGAIWFTLLLYLLGFILGWELLTHRLIRFLTPCLPFVALLIGIGTVLLFDSRSHRNSKKKISWRTIAIVIIFGFGFSHSFLNSFLNQKDYLVSADTIQKDEMRYGIWTVLLNERMPDEAGTLLLIGDARAFAYRGQVLYSTCWDNSPLISFLEDTVVRNKDGTVRELTNPQRLLSRLREAKIDYILVDFGELARFRSKGNYGFSDPEITPELFELLELHGVIRHLPKPEKGAEQVTVYRVE